MLRYALIAPMLLLAGCSDHEPPLALGTLERDRIALTATAAEVIVALPVAEGTPVTKGTRLMYLAKVDQPDSAAKFPNGVPAQVEMP